MSGNHAVIYIGPGKVEVCETEYPAVEVRDGPGGDPANVGRRCPHSVILKVLTNNCGSDQHMVCGRTTARPSWSSGTRSPGR